MKKVMTLMITAALAVVMVGSASAQAAGPKQGTQNKGAQGKGGGPQQFGGGQRQGGGQRMGGMRMGGGVRFLLMPDNAKKLGITPAQKTKLEAIQKEADALMKPYQADFEKMRNASPDEREKNRAKMMEVFQKLRPKMEAITKKVDAVLTADQKKKVEAMRKEMRGRMGGPGGPGGPGGGAGGPGRGGAGGGAKGKGGGGL